MKIYCLRPEVDADQLIHRGLSRVRLEHDKPYREDALRDAMRLNNDKIAEWFEFLGAGPPESGKIETKAELAGASRALRDWIKGPVARRFGWGPIIAGVGYVQPDPNSVRSVAVPLIRELAKAAVWVGWGEQHNTDQLNETEAITLLNRIVDWAEAT